MVEEQPVQLPDITVRWGGKRVRVSPRRSHYIDNLVPAITAYADGELGMEPYGAVSVNMDIPPDPGCIWVKTWSENEGLLDQLVALGVLERTGRTRMSGYVEAPEARLIGDWAP